MIGPPPVSQDVPLVPGLHAAAPSNEAEKSGPVQTPRAAMESADLFKGRKTVEISHNGVIYRLQATRLGKLILTK